MTELLPFMYLLVILLGLVFGYICYRGIADNATALGLMLKFEMLQDCDIDKPLERLIGDFEKEFVRTRKRKDDWHIQAGKCLVVLHNRLAQTKVPDELAMRPHVDRAIALVAELAGLVGERKDPRLRLEVEELRAMNFLALAYFSDLEGNLQKSRQVHLDVLSGMDRLEERSKHPSVVSGMATASFLLCEKVDAGKYCAEAIRWQREAISFVDPDKNERLYLDQNIRLVLAYDRLLDLENGPGDVKDALATARSLAEYCAKKGWVDRQTSVEIFIADALVHLSRYENGEANLKKAIEIYARNIQTGHVANNKGLREETEKKLRAAESELAAGKVLSS